MKRHTIRMNEATTMPDFTRWLSAEQLIQQIQDAIPTVAIDKQRLARITTALGVRPRVAPWKQNMYLYAPEWVDAYILYLRTGSVTLGLPFAQED